MHTSKKGEITTTLAFLSLVIMFLGVLAGNKTIQTGKQMFGNAAGNCEYHSVMHIRDTKLQNVDNGFARTSTVYKNNDPVGSQDKVITDRDPEDSRMLIDKYDTTDLPLNYRGAVSKIKLTNIPTGYRVVNFFCGLNGSTCPNVSLSSDKSTIENVPLDCGYQVSYGFVVEKVTSVPTEEPTPTSIINNTPVPTTRLSPTPTTVPFCFYNAKAQVFKYDKSGNIAVLTKSEGGVDSNFGISNNKQNQTLAAGMFGKSTFNGSTSSVGDVAKYIYGNQHEPFLPTPGAMYSRGDTASVTLIGLNDKKWKIVEMYCNSNNGGKGCPINTSAQNPSKTIQGFTTDCGVDIQYGWIVQDANPTSTPMPTPTTKVTPPPTNNPVPSAIPTPTITVRKCFETCDWPNGTGTFRCGKRADGKQLTCQFVPGWGQYHCVNPDFPESLTCADKQLPTPTTGPSCTNNLGTIRGHIRFTFQSAMQAKSYSPNIVRSTIIIKACKKVSGKTAAEDTADCSNEYNEISIQGTADTDYSIPNVPSDKEVAIVYQEGDDNTFKLGNVGITNCGGPNSLNKHLGGAGPYGGQVCVVQIPSPSCSDGPDYNATVVVPTVAPTSALSCQDNKGTITGNLTVSGRLPYDCINNFSGKCPIWVFVCPKIIYQGHEIPDCDNSYASQLFKIDNTGTQKYTFTGIPADKEVVVVPIVTWLDTGTTKTNLIQKMYRCSGPGELNNPNKYILHQFDSTVGDDACVIKQIPVPACTEGTDIELKFNTKEPTATPTVTPVIPTQTPETLTCEDVASAGGNWTETKFWDLKTNQGTFWLSYTMLDQPDQMDIYYGDDPNSDLWPKIWSTNGQVSGYRSNIVIPFSSNTPTATRIKVVVTGNKDNTAWFYGISCKDPSKIPSGPTCRETETTGTITGKLEVTGELPAQCADHNGCVFSVKACSPYTSLRNGLGGNVFTTDCGPKGGTKYSEYFASEPDYTFTLDNIPTNKVVGITIDGRLLASDSHSTQLGMSYPIALNCTIPRETRFLPNECFVNVNKELSCRASEVNFKMIYIHPVDPNNPYQNRQDVNNDGVVNAIDYAMVLQQYGKNGTTMKADINGDFVVNSLDTSLVVASFGTNVNNTSRDSTLPNERF